MKALDLKPLELFIVQTKLLPINFKKMDSNLKWTQTPRTHFSVVYLPRLFCYSG